MERNRHDALVPVIRWDRSVPYLETAVRQEELVARQRETFILCEHPPTITLGTGADRNDLAFPSIYYERQGISIVKSPRGGKATYHGPGQLVVYPILNLRSRNWTIHAHLRFLESLMIFLCSRYGIHAQSIAGRAGAWVGEKKIGFIGVRVRKGFAFHGLSFNVTPQHEPFRWIIPCGMPNLRLTSLQEEMASECPDLWTVADIMEDTFFRLLPAAAAENHAADEWSREPVCFGKKEKV